MDIPESCIGCPNLVFYQDALAEAERNRKMLIADATDVAADREAWEDFDYEGAPTEMSEAMDSYFGWSLSRQAEAVEKAFGTNDGLQAICRDILSGLIENCRTGVKVERQYKILGKLVVKCGSKDNKSVGAHTIDPAQEFKIPDLPI